MQVQDESRLVFWTHFYDLVINEGHDVSQVALPWRPTTRRQIAAQLPWRLRSVALGAGAEGDDAVASRPHGAWILPGKPPLRSTHTYTIPALPPCYLTAVPYTPAADGRCRAASAQALPKEMQTDAWYERVKLLEEANVCAPCPPRGDGGGRLGDQT